MSELSSENQEMLDELKSQDPDFSFEMLESGDELFLQDTTKSSGGDGTADIGWSSGIIEVDRNPPPTIDKEPDDDKTPKPPPPDDEKRLRIGDKVRVKATGEIGIVISIDKTGVADIQIINE